MKTAIEQTYEDVEKMVHHVTNRFMGKKGIGRWDYDEWHGEACRAFASSYDSYDPGRAMFTTHLWHGIWHALADKLQRDAPHWTTRHYEQEDAEEIEDRSSSAFQKDCFILSLSDDANTVVRLVLGAGGCVDDDCKEADPGEIRVGLYLLLTNFGWSFRRIVEAFHEIKTCLLD